jgi:hypothetical protein
VGRAYRHILGLDEAFPIHEPPHHGTFRGPQRAHIAQELIEFRRHVMLCKEAERLAVVAPQSPARGIAQAQRFLEHRLEHGCQFAGRGIDDLQHLGSRGLLSERLVTLGSRLGKLASQIGYEPLGIG